MGEQDKEQLEQQIEIYREQYYCGKPLISDAEYDALEKRLLQLDSTNIVANTVGGVNTDDAITYEAAMLSLDKEYDLEALHKYFHPHEIIAEPKLDGNAINLQYIDGQLITGSTRGRGGKTGTNVTKHVKSIKNIPQVLPVKFTGSIRGEAVLRPATFKKLKEAALKKVIAGKLNEKDVPSSPRNYGTAAFMTDDYNAPRKRGLKFLAYEAITEQDQYFDEEVAKMRFLSSLGFTIPDYWLIRDRAPLDSYQRIIDQYKEFANQVDRNYDIDGVVFKINSFAKQEELGSTAKHPRYAKAFKWETETGATKLLQIENKVGTTGRMTFTAITEPIFLSNATLSRFTLHNAQWIRERNIAIGDTLHVTRSGEVIPKVLDVLSHNGNPCTLPSKCPCCGTKLISSGVDLICTNEECEEQVLRLIEHFVKVVDIKELGGSTLLALVDKGLIKTPGDIYRLTEKQLASLVRESGSILGSITAKKILHNINSAKKIAMGKLIAAVGIKGIGVTVGERLEKIFNSDLDTFYNTIVNDNAARQLTKHDGFGGLIASAIILGAKAKKHIIDDLLSVGVKVSKPALGLSTKFVGTTFVVTGTLSEPREQIIKTIKQNGGAVSNTVSRKTNYLIAGENTGKTKTDKAVHCGTIILNEQQFRDLLQS